MRQILPLFLAVFVSITLFGQGRTDGRIMLQGRMDGSQEVPAVSTKGKGFFTVFIEENYSSITVTGIVDSLSGPIKSCHIHDGGLGVAGPVVIDLSTKINGNRIYGRVSGISRDFIKKMIRGGTYFNVHTAANPGGEIRGQLYTETDLHFVSIMTASSEIPTNSSTGFGLGSFVLNQRGDSIQYKAIVTGLTGPITATHFHIGSASVSGPVAVPLSFKNNVISGTAAMPVGFFDSLAVGSVYWNVHTAANPGGEIRGQINFAGYNAFEAQMNGAQETPPVTTTANGLMVAFTNGTLDTLTYYAVYDGVTPTAAHFHTGAFGVAGPVLVALTPYTRAPNTYVGVLALDSSLTATFLKGGMYANIHSTANPGGEIRGQVVPSVRQGYIADMCSAQETPPTTSNATGLGAITLDRNKSNLHIEMVTTGLTANATSSHIHIGAKGVAGPVFINFGTPAGNQVSGYATNLRSTLIDSITAAGYFNIHTPLNPGGEIRGQIGKLVSSECLLASGTYELNGKTLKVVLSPNPAQDVVNVNFESNDAFQAHYTISDFTGRTVTQKQINVQSGANEIGVNVSDLANGIYFIQMRTSTNLLFSEKLVKQ